MKNRRLKGCAYLISAFCALLFLCLLTFSAFIWVAAFAFEEEPRTVLDLDCGPHKELRGPNLSRSYTDFCLYERQMCSYGWYTDSCDRQLTCYPSFNEAKKACLGGRWCESEVWWNR